MSRSSKPVIAITMGDPQGIGPEVTCKALSQRSLLSKANFIVVGNRKLLKKLPAAATVIDVPYIDAAEGALKFLDRAILLIKGGIADAMVTAPLSKEKVSLYARNFVGHTEYLARAFDAKNFDMMFVAPGMRLSIVTRHVPLKKVPALITIQAVSNSIALMHETLKHRFKIRMPKIAVLGLNPHAGENGLLGTEDLKVIVPAIAKARSRGIKAVGPLPADTYFAFHHQYDGTVAMYHDQGLAPIKGLYMKNLVNYTAGLPFIRTSPAHGTAFDIAGKGLADPSSMIASVKLACGLS